MSRALLCGILHSVSGTTPLDFELLYAQFDAPISTLDCGRKCAPYNEYGVPFCCDTRHTVPTAYSGEWFYLRSNTNLWHPWAPDDLEELKSLESDTPEGQTLIECLGHKKCQRNFRTITCRAFPFAPYINSHGDFIGLTYYWQYEDRCWIINNLDQVTQFYLDQFMGAYDQFFNYLPREFSEFRYHSQRTRDIFFRAQRTIPLIHRNGYTYKISPRNERMRRFNPKLLPKYGPYKIAAAMPFPDEKYDVSNLGDK